MTVRISKIAIYCLLFLILPCKVWPQQKVDGSDVRNPLQVFVQDFYDWYVPNALSDHSEPAWDFALKYRSRHLVLSFFEHSRRTPTPKPKRPIL